MGWTWAWRRGPTGNRHARIVASQTSKCAAKCASTAVGSGGNATGPIVLLVLIPGMPMSLLSSSAANAAADSCLSTDRCLRDARWSPGRVRQYHRGVMPTGKVHQLMKPLLTDCLPCFVSRRMAGMVVSMDPVSGLVLNWWDLLPDTNTKPTPLNHPHHLAIPPRLHLAPLSLPNTILGTEKSGR